MPYGLSDNQWDAAREEMRSVLIGRARERRTITYGELSREIGAAHLEPRHRRFGALLNEVCDSEDAQGRPMLGSLVVKSDTRMPGAGYFRAARELARDVETEREFWEAELEQVFDHWQSTEGSAGEDA